VVASLPREEKEPSLPKDRGKTHYSSILGFYLA
jgi:hypothetical protein